MNQYLLPLNKAAEYCGVEKEILKSLLTVSCVNGVEMVSSTDVNSLILTKKIAYKFTEINSRTNTDEFCSKRTISPSEYNVIDLFCGAGGSSSGFRMAGFNLIGALDVNQAAAKTHELNFRDCKTVVGDITKISPKSFSDLIGNKRVDVVIGSPPCQTFSSLSQGKIKSLGKDIRHDIRNYFYKNYLDYIAYFKPRAFVMENVPGFMSKYNGEIFLDFLKYLEEKMPEYTVVHTILDAKDFSVPQSRKRLFVCGFKKDIDFSFPQKNYEFCSNSTIVSVEEAIKDLPLITDDWRLDRMPYSLDSTTPYQQMMRTDSDTVRNNICRISNDKAKELFDQLKPGQRFLELPEVIQKQISLFDTFNSSVIMGRCHRLPLKDVSWTVIAHIGMDGYEYIHPTECRTLSVREAARLQSFTDDFVFVGNMREQYVQIGNAVPPLLSYAIAKTLRDSLDNSTL